MKFKNIKKRKFKKMLLTSAFLISLTVLIWYSFIFEPNNIQIEKINIEIENLPESFNNTKIVHLTDFHSYNFGEREKKVLEILEDINPDFVFITGDFIDHKTKDISSCQEFWSELGNRYQGKVYSVLGNHEYWIDHIDANSIKRLLEKSGIVVLSNENEKIFQDNEYIYLLGVNDPHTGNDDLGVAAADTEKDIPKILLAHSPDIVNDLENLEKEKIDLILAGHTHGGQFVIPFIQPYWTPTKNHGKYASGLFKIGNAYLYVNRGIGMAVLPIRFNCPPEIAVIELRGR
ncbi:MAG: metallophosphoesterase [Patescibacteria group bacterium]|nr:metallophosphoesterase [Patescibacteria group bacterium]